MATSGIITRFEDVLAPSFYTSVPSDHWVVLTDLRGSTAAIQAGRYKDVNTVGAATIIACLNACNRDPLPFVFGGDGAALVIPPQHLEATRKALQGCKKMAREAFGFELRCGMVPLVELEASGVKLEKADYQIVPGLSVPAFRGGALARADQWVKDPHLSAKYEVLLPTDGTDPEADFTGLECRWKPIPSERGLVVSLIVKFRDPDSEAGARGLIGRIAHAARWEAGTPVFRKAQLRLAVTMGELLSESRVITHQAPRWITRLRALALATLSLLVGRIVYAIRPPKPLPVAWLPDWKKYFEGVLTQVDDRKFDDVLRTVIDCTPQDWSSLEAELLRLRDEGKVTYGAHVSREMLMTCMVLDRELRHLHFVDGANGGYAMAAKQLKSPAPKPG